MKRKLLLTVALLLVVVAGTMVWLAWRQQRARTITLADGSRLEFLGATTGTNCRFNYGSVWQRLVARLPHQWQQKVGSRVVQNAVVNAGFSGDSTVVFWFARRGGPAGVKTAKVVYKGSPQAPTYAIGVGERRDDTLGFSVAERLRINLKDDQGEGLPGLRQFSEADLPSGDVALFWRPDVVPETSEVVFLRVYEWRKETGWKYVGQMEVPNPFLHAKR